jgi:hypothetical protein
MKVVPAYDSQGLFRRPVKITQLEDLETPPAERRPLASETTVYISRTVRFEMAPPAKEAKKDEKVTLGSFAKDFGVGAGLAAGSMGIIPLAKGTTEAQLAAALKGFGFAPGASDQIASSSLGFARSNLGQISCVFLAGGFVTVGLIEGVGLDWTWKKKLAYFVGGGLVLVLLALLLNYLGIWGGDAKEPAGTAPAVTSHGPGWAEAAERFDREKGPVAAVLLEADKVEPFRIEPGVEMAGGIDSQKVLYKARPLDKKLSAQLATSFLDPKSYLSPGWDAKLCAFQPRVALRFWKGKQFLDVLVCFDCTQLMVVERDPAVPLRSLGGLEARFRVGGDFEPIEGDLKKVMAEIFADDPDLARIIDLP